METTPEIMFKGIIRTSYIDKLIERGIAKLERVCSYIISTRVTVEQTQTRHRTDNPYAVLALGFGIFMINIFATPNP